MFTTGLPKGPFSFIQVTTGSLVSGRTCECSFPQKSQTKQSQHDLTELSTYFSPYPCLTWLSALKPAREQEPSVPRHYRRNARHQHGDTRAAPTSVTSPTTGRQSRSSLQTTPTGHTVPHELCPAPPPAPRHRPRVRAALLEPAAKYQRRREAPPGAARAPTVTNRQQATPLLGRGAGGGLTSRGKGGAARVGRGSARARRQYVRCALIGSAPGRAAGACAVGAEPCPRTWRRRCGAGTRSSSSRSHSRARRRMAAGACRCRGSPTGWTCGSSSSSTWRSSWSSTCCPEAAGPKSAAAGERVCLGWGSARRSGPGRASTYPLGQRLRCGGSRREKGGVGVSGGEPLFCAAGRCAPRLGVHG